MRYVGRPKDLPIIILDEHNNVVVEFIYKSHLKKSLRLTEEEFQKHIKTGELFENYYIEKRGRVELK